MTNKAKIGASIVLDGEKEFKSAVTACSKKLATMRSELGLVKEKYAENTDGMEWDIPDDNVNVESTVLEPIAVNEFLDTLSETDRKILTMRMDNVTLEKIAEELGFKTHSAIHKRIRKIGLAYEKFSGEDLGFSNKHII